MTKDKIKDRMLLSIPADYKKRLQMKAIQEGKTVAKLIRDWLDGVSK